MDFGLISKRDKARRYAEERERFTFEEFKVKIKGTNNDHYVTYNHGNWDCDCGFFASHNYCGHTMSLEIILDKMLKEKEK
ncbi:MAG: hypothetical protein K8R40_02995 [Anaerolineaceae bacterium]|nr:hypothetical protein [Anaerolineaceae bacterium]